MELEVRKAGGSDIRMPKTFGRPMWEAEALKISKIPLRSQMCPCVPVRCFTVINLAQESLGRLWKTRALSGNQEVVMAQAFPPLSTHTAGFRSFGTAEFEPLLDSGEAARLLRIHPKTLQKMARRGEIHGTHVGKLWRFRASDLNDWIFRQEQAS
ncbi:MAG TPA: helix-turn-helix domain-containing protein [Acidobacteriaceae bacterium]|nr:helix-turn-helix domain-containing protein [Acidobacteriaceae bacterium]